MIRYQAKRIFVQTDSDDEDLNTLLYLGWEPFAVTMADYGQYVYHLRRVRP